MNSRVAEKALFVQAHAGTIQYDKMADAGRSGSADGEEPPKSIWPVFFKARDIPVDPEKGWISTAEICKTIEEFAGHGTMYAAQRCGGLWRLYTKNEKTRLLLLSHGLELRDVAVTLYEKNPFIVRERDESESQKDTTRLVISQIPMSYSKEDILNAIQATGVTVVSNMQDEHGRDGRGQLTRWKTGNRFVYIVVPDNPLPKFMKVGNFTATLYHKEQKLQEKRENTECRRCLEKGHVARECTGPLRCKACKGENHKSSDPMCPVNREEVEVEEQGTKESHSGNMKETQVESTPNRRNRSWSLPRGSVRRIDDMLQKVREDVGKKVLHSPPTPPDVEGKKQKRAGTEEVIT